MDNLDNFDSGDSGTIDTGNSSAEGVREASREQSEKQKEKSSKTLAGIRRSQKDEWKSKKHSNLLAKIISYMVEHDDQNAALPFILEMLEQGIPSNLIISFTIIIDPKILELVLW
jgi:hypothetical protein